MELKANWGDKLAFSGNIDLNILGLGTPERVTLYYTEAASRMSTTRTDEELDAARRT